MFKSQTRKGLAIAAALTLALTGLVSSPAQAAGEVVLQPSAGTTYNTLVTETFKLQTSMGAGQPAGNIANLKYKIEKASTVPLTIGAAAATTPATTSHNAASTSFVVSPGSTSSTVPNFITIAVTGASAATASADVTITAWIDSTPNDVIDAGEFSQVRVISFKKYADVATSVVVTQPLEGDTAIAGTATLTDINLSQVQSTVQVKAYFAGAATNSAALTDGKFSAAYSALTGSATVSADVVVGSDKIGTSSATYTVTAKAVKSVTASAVVGDNAINASAGAVTARVNSAFVVKGTALNGTTSTASGVAGAAVTVKVTTSATLTSTQSITLNGTVYTDSAKLPSALAVTADAAGVASVNVATAGLAANEKVSFFFTSQNTNANVLEANLANAAYKVESTGANNYRTVATSSAFAIDYTVADQWKVALPAGYRIVVAYDGTTKYVPVVGGAAKAEFTATSSATTSDVTNSDLEKQNTTTLNWSTVSATTASAIAVKSTNVAAKFDTAPTHSATATIARATTSNTAGYLSRVTVSGQVNHAGQSVTVTSTGVQFSTAAEDEKAVANTITTLADGAGWWTVSAYVVKAGAATFAYSAGAATASTTLTAAAALGNQGTVLTLVTVDSILPGKTLVATVKLVDEHGNPVAADDAATESFGVTVTGLGFVGTLPTKLNASGEATVTVLLGSADEGTVVITATYDADGAGTAKTAVTATKTVTIGAVEVSAVVGSFKGRWAVRIENGKGSTIAVKAGGKWYKYLSLNDNYLFSRKSRVGAELNVKVYVDGSLQEDKTITVK